MVSLFSTMLFGNSGKFSVAMWAEGDKVREASLCFLIRVYDLYALLASEAECFVIGQIRFRIGLMNPFAKSNAIDPDMPCVITLKWATQRLINAVNLAACESDFFRQFSRRISHIQKTLEASELWAFESAAKNDRRVACSNVHEKNLLIEFAV